MISKMFLVKLRKTYDLQDIFIGIAVGPTSKKSYVHPGKVSDIFKNELYR